MRALRKWGKTTALVAALAIVGLTHIGCDNLVQGIARDQCFDACQDSCDAQNAAQPNSCDQTDLDDCNAQCNQIG